MESEKQLFVLLAQQSESWLPLLGLRNHLEVPTHSQAVGLNELVLQLFGIEGLCGGFQSSTNEEWHDYVVNGPFLINLEKLVGGLEGEPTAENPFARDARASACLRVWNWSHIRENPFIGMLFQGDDEPITNSSASAKGLGYSFYALARHNFPTNY